MPDPFNVKKHPGERTRVLSVTTARTKREMETGRFDIHGVMVFGAQLHPVVTSSRWYKEYGSTDPSEYYLRFLINAVTAITTYATITTSATIKPIFSILTI